MKLAALAVVGAKPGPESVMVQPTPPQTSVSVPTQDVANEVEIVVALAALPVEVVVKVNEAVPLGLLIVTNELAGNPLNSAEARFVGDEPLL